MDQSGNAANPARGQLNRKRNISLSPFVPENLVSRERFGRPVPRQSAHVHPQVESGAYSRDSSRFPRRRLFIYTAKCHRVSPEFYQVTQLRNDAAGAGPVVLKVVPAATGVAFSGITHGPIHVRVSFPTSTLGM